MLSLDMILRKALSLTLLFSLLLVISVHFHADDHDGAIDAQPDCTQCHFLSSLKTPDISQADSQVTVESQFLFEISSSLHCPPSYKSLYYLSSSSRGPPLLA